MIKNAVPFALVLIVLAAGGAPATAQEATTRPGVTVAPEPADRLSRSLDDIADSLRQLLRAEKTQIVLRRIELEERRLAPQSAELRGARSEVRGIKDEIRYMRIYVQDLESDVESELLAGADQDREAMRDQLETIQAEIRLNEEKLTAAERRVVDLEIDLAEGRDRIDILDERLLELLEASGD
jgi:chromosome segregation ATPase